MAENIFSSFNASGQGMSVQRLRLSSVAKNIANANTTKGPNGLPYQREIVVVHSKNTGSFDSELDNQIELFSTDNSHSSNIANKSNPNNFNIVDATTLNDDSPPRLVYDPNHPDADENGYVKMPNINIVTEMVEMISAQRAFEANTNVFESAKNIARDSLDI